MHLGRGCSAFFNSSSKRRLIAGLPDCLDLLDIQGMPGALEITFRHREVSGGSGASVEVLVPPIIRRRNDGTFLPVEFTDFDSSRPSFPAVKSLSHSALEYGFVG